jgi:hypothetical protein
MYHGKGDLDGASASVFWLPYDHRRRCFNSTSPSGGGTSDTSGSTAEDAVLRQVNRQFSLFAYVVEGAEVLPLLRPGDIVLRTMVMEKLQ